MNTTNIVSRSVVAILTALATAPLAAPVAEDALSPRVAERAPDFRGNHPVRPVVHGTNHTIFAEAEEFQVRDPGWEAKDWGRITTVPPLRSPFTLRIEQNGAVKLERLDDVLAYLDAHPVAGKPPRRLIVYGYTFDTGSDPGYNARVERFVEMIGLTRIYDRDKPHYSLGNPALRGPSGYLQPTRDFDAQLESLRGDKAIDRIRTVSLGDEIALARPLADGHDGFRAWAREQGLKPRQLGVAAWDAVQYLAGDEAAEDNPGGYYYSRRYAHAFGIERLRKWTERIRAALPNADTGANFSPHHGGPGLSYTGEAHKWITLFREGGMTMPWSEDYIWQLPVGSQQMNFLLLDLFRAGLRYRPEAQIHMYVMPHRPGNRTDSWRRLWYGNLGSGMKIANLFEFRPLQVSYTDHPAPAGRSVVRKDAHVEQ